MNNEGFYTSRKQDDGRTDEKMSHHFQTTYRQNQIPKGVDSSTLCKEKMTDDEYIETLDYIMTTIELEVPYAELIYHEDVLHEELNEVVRFIVMNRGNKDFYVSYGYNGCIYSYTKSIPRLLLLDIHNAICIALDNQS